VAIEFLDFESYIKYGYDKGWISDVFCNTHEGPPFDEDEMEEWEEGGDPCSFHVKVNELH